MLRFFAKKLFFQVEVYPFIVIETELVSPFLGFWFRFSIIDCLETIKVRCYGDTTVFIWFSGFLHKPSSDLISET